MVWALLPVDSDAQKFYIFSKGTYKVGRRDCDVIIQTDRAVSRVHAEIIVNTMASRDPSCNKSVSLLSDVRIRDLSKFGTFINKELGSNAVYSCPNKEANLKDGDLASFGTGNAIYRFCFVTFVIFIHSSKSFQANPSIQDTILSIGAYATHSWSSECTHVLSDEYLPVTEDIIDAIVVQKPVVLSTWFKILAEKNICTEIPSCSPYVPTLTLDGVSVKIVEPKVREKCLRGYTFVLGSAHLYKFGAKLPALLQVVGAKVLNVDEFSSSSQTSEDGGNNQLVLVIPAGSVNEFNRFNHLTTLFRVTDTTLVAAVLSGYLEPSILKPPSIHVSSSHSTDETIVEDSDVEIYTATSSHVAEVAKLEDAIEDEAKENIAKYEDKQVDGDSTVISSEKKNFTSSKDEDGCIIERKDKGDDSEASGYQNSDIIYSQVLVVRNTTMPTPLRSSSKKNVVNFKCFRKRETVSGNSFKDLIPFAKNPYKESDCGNNETAEYMREEKKRKQMEAVAEDLFNNEKAKKRGIAGSSLHAFLSRC